MEQIKTNDKIVLSTREREIFKTLRTNIELSGIDAKTIVVTSCRPNDGKSTITYFLANSFAELEKKTLFIDADLRKSVFYSEHGIEPLDKGLVHVLAGQIKPEEAIYSVQKRNLYIMPIGVFSRNPSELLSNKRMDDLLKYVKDNFDYIIIDTPPIGSVMDAAILANKVDATMLVAAQGVVSKHIAKQAIDTLKNANPNFLGVVLNKVDVRKAGYYGRRNSYYYSYNGYYGKY